MASNLSSVSTEVSELVDDEKEEGEISLDDVSSSEEGQPYNLPKGLENCCPHCKSVQTCATWCGNLITYKNNIRKGIGLQGKENRANRQKYIRESEPLAISLINKFSRPSSQTKKNASSIDVPHRGASDDLTPISSGSEIDLSSLEQDEPKKRQSSSRKKHKKRRRKLESSKIDIAFLIKQSIHKLEPKKESARSRATGRHHPSEKYKLSPRRHNRSPITKSKQRSRSPGQKKSSASKQRKRSTSQSPKSSPSKATVDLPPESPHARGSLSRLLKKVRRLEPFSFKSGDKGSSLKDKLSGIIQPTKCQNQAKEVTYSPERQTEPAKDDGNTDSVKEVSQPEFVHTVKNEPVTVPEYADNLANRNDESKDRAVGETKAEPCEVEEVETEINQTATVSPVPSSRPASPLRPPDVSPPPSPNAKLPNFCIDDNEEDLKLRMIALHSAVMKKHLTRMKKSGLKKTKQPEETTIPRMESPFSLTFLGDFPRLAEVCNPSALIGCRDDVYFPEDMELDSDLELEMGEADVDMVPSPNVDVSNQPSLFDNKTMSTLASVQMTPPEQQLSLRSSSLYSPLTPSNIPSNSSLYSPSTPTMTLTSSILYSPSSPTMIPTNSSLYSPSRPTTTPVQFQKTIQICDPVTGCVPLNEEDAWKQLDTNCASNLNINIFANQESRPYSPSDLTVYDPDLPGVHSNDAPKQASGSTAPPLQPPPLPPLCILDADESLMLDCPTGLLEPLVKPIMPPPLPPPSLLNNFPVVPQSLNPLLMPAFTYPTPTAPMTSTLANSIGSSSASGLAELLSGTSSSRPILEKPNAPLQRLDSLVDCPSNRVEPTPSELDNFGETDLDGSPLVMIEKSTSHGSWPLFDCLRDTSNVIRTDRDGAAPISEQNAHYIPPSTFDRLDHECAAPKYMATGIFKPMRVQTLPKKNIVSTSAAAFNMSADDDEYMEELENKRDSRTQSTGEPCIAAHMSQSKEVLIDYTDRSRKRRRKSVAPRCAKQTIGKNEDCSQSFIEKRKEIKVGPNDGEARTSRDKMISKRAYSSEEDTDKEKTSSNKEEDDPETLREQLLASLRNRQSKIQSATTSKSPLSSATVSPTKLILDENSETARSSSDELIHISPPKAAAETTTKKMLTIKKPVPIETIDQPARRIAKKAYIVPASTKSVNNAKRYQNSISQRRLAQQKLMAATKSRFKFNDAESAATPQLEKFNKDQNLIINVNKGDSETESEEEEMKQIEISVEQFLKNIRQQQEKASEKSVTIGAQNDPTSQLSSSIQSSAAISLASTKVNNSGVTAPTSSLVSNENIDASSSNIVATDPTSTSIAATKSAYTTSFATINTTTAAGTPASSTAPNLGKEKFTFTSSSTSGLKKLDFMNTPQAVKHLPAPLQEEYRRLKQQIIERERLKLQKSKEIKTSVSASTSTESKATSTTTSTTTTTSTESKTTSTTTTTSTDSKATTTTTSTESKVTTTTTSTDSMTATIASTGIETSATSAPLDIPKTLTEVVEVSSASVVSTPSQVAKEIGTGDVCPSLPSTPTPILPNSQTIHSHTLPSISVDKQFTLVQNKSASEIQGAITVDVASKHQLEIPKSTASKVPTTVIPMDIIDSTTSRSSKNQSLTNETPTTVTVSSSKSQSQSLKMSVSSRKVASKPTNSCSIQKLSKEQAALLDKMNSVLNKQKKQISAVAQKVSTLTILTKDQVNTKTPQISSGSETCINMDELNKPDNAISMSAEEKNEHEVPPKKNENDNNKNVSNEESKDEKSKRDCQKTSNKSTTQIKIQSTNEKSSSVRKLVNVDKSNPGWKDFKDLVDDEVQSLFDLSNEEQKKLLTESEEKLITKRHVVLDNIADMSDSLKQWEKERDVQNSLSMEIEKLHEQLRVAEEKFQQQRIKLNAIQPKVSKYHERINDGRKECFRLSKICDNLGQIIAGPDYKVPNEGAELLNDKIKEVASHTQKLKNKTYQAKQNTNRASVKTAISNLNRKNSNKKQDKTNNLKSDIVTRSNNLNSDKTTANVEISLDESVKKTKCTLRIKHVHQINSEIQTLKTTATNNASEVTSNLKLNEKAIESDGASKIIIKTESPDVDMLMDTNPVRTNESTINIDVTNPSITNSSLGLITTKVNFSGTESNSKVIKTIMPIRSTETNNLSDTNKQLDTCENSDNFNSLIKERNKSLKIKNISVKRKRLLTKASIKGVNSRKSRNTKINNKSIISSKKSINNESVLVITCEENIGNIRKSALVKTTEPEKITSDTIRLNLVEKNNVQFQPKESFENFVLISSDNNINNSEKLNYLNNTKKTQSRQNVENNLKTNVCYNVNQDKHSSVERLNKNIKSEILDDLETNKIGASSSNSKNSTFLEEITLLEKANIVEVPKKIDAYKRTKQKINEPFPKRIIGCNKSKNPKNFQPYESILKHLHEPRNKVDGILCPYELTGTCNDEDCQFIHLSTSHCSG